MNRKALREMGLTVWSFWEHDLNKNSVERTVRRLRRKLSKVLIKRAERTRESSRQ